MKVLLIICVYNESGKIENTVSRIYQMLGNRKREPQIDFLLFDDGSTDGAPQQIKEKYDCHLLRNEEKKGVGYSIRESYLFGVKNGYDILITMAGNNKDDPEQIDRLIDPIYQDKADFVQGSRYLPGGDFGKMPVYRYFATKFVHPIIFSCISGKRITDSTNGYRSIRASILEDPKIDISQSWLDAYELEPYLFCQAIRLGYDVREAPVSKIYPDKKLGYSKMKPITGWWSILKPLFYLFFGIKR